MNKTVALILLLLTVAVANAQDVVVNEFMADNQSTIADPTDNGFDDWIELYNGGSTEVNLSGFYLTDDGALPKQWPFPDTSIAPGGFLLIWADGDSSNTGLHTNFKLSKGGEFVGLYFDSGTEITAVDTVSFGQQSPDISYGRLPDGSENFTFFSPATPGAPNSGEIRIPQLFVNEFMADNTSTLKDPTDGRFEDWIEIYSGEDMDVSLTNFFLTDDPDNPTQWPFPDIEIAERGFLLVWADRDSGDAGLHTNFALGAGGEFVGIYFDTGTDTIAIDTLSFGQQGSDISYGRLPDGSSTLTFFSPATPGAPNSGEIIIPDLFINELMVDNTFTLRDPTDDVFEDWIEIYNAGDTEVNLGSFFLTDNKSTPGQWQFPDTTLAPGEFILVWADNDSGDEGLHTNFALSKSGDFVGLFWDTGVDTVIVDAKKFGAQRSDISLGRSPDGGDTFVLFVVSTPGASNAGGTVLVERNLYINELMAENIAFLQDTTDDNFEDWLEIYNGGVSPVNLTSYYLSDARGLPTMWALPDTSLEPGDFLFVWVDNDPGADGLHTNFKLSKSGEFVGLYFDAGIDTLAIDTLRFGVQSPDTSFGRNPDGSDEFVFYAQATPGKSNLNGVIVSVAEQPAAIVEDFALRQNYPNPFNPETSISYAIPQDAHVKLTIFNLLGQRVVTLVDKEQTRGRYLVSWNGKSGAGDGIASGVYLYRLEAGAFVETRKMLMLK